MYPGADQEVDDLTKQVGSYFSDSLKFIKKLNVFVPAPEALHYLYQRLTDPFRSVDFPRSDLEYR
jgi:hypothetical protein